MDIGNAIKITIAAAVGVKLAVGSFRSCRVANRYNAKWEYLREKGHAVEDLLFKTEKQLDEMLEQA